MKYIVSVLSPLSLLIFIIVVGAEEVKDCSSKPPFRREVEDILKILGYSTGCIVPALTQCNKNCEYDIKESFATIKNVLGDMQIKLNEVNSIFAEAASCIHNPQEEEPKGETETKVSNFRNCLEIRNSGGKQSGGQTVNLHAEGSPATAVFCDQTTDGGGWTVIQRRQDLPVRENFYRNWADYVNGFGKLAGEFWLGLENIHALTDGMNTELRVDMEDTNGEKRFAKYSNFSIDGLQSSYVLRVGGYSGDAGDSLAYHNNRSFKTYDEDGTGCSEKYKGAWWYGNCHDSNLNGHQYVGKTTTYADGIIWDKWKGDHYSLPKVTMMIR